MNAPTTLQEHTRLDIEAAPGIRVTLEIGGAPAADHHGLTAQDLVRAPDMPDWRYAEYLAGRRALRRLLAAHFPEARTAPVAYTPQGRPHLPQWPRIGISVSHDADAVAACVGLDHAVGVDVQYPPTTVHPAMLRHSAKDRAEELALLPVGPRATELAWMWTVREAVLKSAGTGLAGGVWSADVPPYAPHGAWGPYRWVALRDRSPIPLSCAFTAPSGPDPRTTAPGEPRE
ncbi:4'-phosphopantetheinyl transferase family protein [Streptomyces sp. NPDC098789]|uniref:4'-phosphopantetheinyl transferase family protein n=1 Tax=Streptomyces sp. NPDC098789 TaxID=3366098 RepID=UPI00380E279A